MVWEYHSTYRGVDIEIWRPEGTPYSALFGGLWHYADTLAAIKAEIDAFLGPEPEPEGYWEYHSTYRGIDIEIWRPMGTPYSALFGGLWHYEDTLAALKAVIDAFLEPEPTIFVIGYVWDYVNERWIRPKFRFGGVVIEAPPGDLFARVDVPPGSYEIEMITEGYTLASWDVWASDPYVPSFTDTTANPTTIHVADNCYYFCYVYPTPEPSVVTSVNIAAPSSVDAGVNFTIFGDVRDQYGEPMGGVTVFLYDNGIHFATVTTLGLGLFFKSTSISTPGVHELAARADSKWAYRDITITEPADIPTNLTIFAPASVEPDETFLTTGILSERDTGVPIQGQSIILSYNGVILGGATTGIDGDYLIQAFIPTAGTYTLKASFAGTTTLGASESTIILRTGALSLAAFAPLAAIGLIAYTIFKK